MSKLARSSRRFFSSASASARGFQVLARQLVELDDAPGQLIGRCDDLAGGGCRRGARAGCGGLRVQRVGGHSHEAGQGQGVQA
jgi:hypothetical protein